ncbi:TolC family outer membrane protein [Sphingorhabdus sp. Alg239-R122]|uniref:TolC family outer membrane protein n=1 Tax=Sphingorhabdus sp. Alg239-R122 TaxID=2305989 RepID=UPI0013DC00D3|nr:TolC family outer membrane protein [Sphingorhabdus sp. Alg239-R122]
MAGAAIAALAFPMQVQADTLREALVNAYLTNPTLAAARAQQRATDETVPIAKADGRPNVTNQTNYTEFLKQSRTSFTSPERQLTSGVQLSVPVYSGGSVRNNVRAAKERVQAGQANLRGTESALFSNVVAAYMDVIRDQAVVSLNAQNVRVLETNLQATSDRFEIGDLTRTDIAQSDSRLAIARSDLQSAAANLIRSKEVYIQLVGNPPGGLEAPPPLPNLPGSPDAAVTIALESNPDLIAAREDIEASRYDIRSANGTKLPRVSVFANGGYSNFLKSLQNVGPDGIPNTNDDFGQSFAQTTADAGVRLTVPLYQGGLPSARVRQSQARYSAALEQAIAVERNVVAQTRAAYSSWRASLQVIESSQQAVEASALSLEGVRAENSVGNRTILDILNAEQELLRAQVQLVTARRNAYVAGFTLLAAMGRAEARDLGLDGGVLYDPQDNYDRVDGKWNDWSRDPLPEPVSTRTVDTPAQTATMGPVDE